MVRYYTFFVTDDSLLASPYIRRFNFLHDLTLQLNKAEDVHFLLQAPLSQKEQDTLQLLYDTNTTIVSNIKVESYHHQSLVTATITPKELGIVRVGISYANKNDPVSKHKSPGWLRDALHLKQ